ncbi:MAG TPA: hypothetical protein VMV10_10845 [Pirellulales bacterium]|nr:hypothetical protein [Pirellulales bacterium]
MLEFAVDEVIRLPFPISASTPRCRGEQRFFAENLRLLWAENLACRRSPVSHAGYSATRFFAASGKVSRGPRSRWEKLFWPRSPITIGPDESAEWQCTLRPSRRPLRTTNGASMTSRRKAIVAFFRSVWHAGVFVYGCFLKVAVPMCRFLDKYFNITSKDYIWRFWR